MLAADLHFLRPWWFIALVPLAILLASLWRSSRGASIWRGLVDQHLLPHLLVGEEGTPRRRPLSLLGLAWVLAVTALAGPVWQRLPQPVFSATGERVILLDLSSSMNAADLAPSRLTRARYEILDLLRETKEGQVALVAFGPEPFLVSPLTGDAQTIAAQVPQLTTDLIPVPGVQRTSLAIKMAGDLLDQAQAHGGEVILVTDGIADPAAAMEAAKMLTSSGRTLSVLAVGTQTGAPVPATGGGFIKDTSGGIAIVHLDPAPLRELARTGHGRFVEAQAGDADTRALLADGPRLGQEVEKTTLLADQWQEEGPWLLLALLPLAALAFRRGWLLSLVAVTLLLPPDPSQAGAWADLWQRLDQQAVSRLDAGDSQGAAAQFRDPAWRAAAHYRAGDYAQAMQSLSGLSGTEADYNRGNALARLGRLDEAADAYERVLNQAPGNEDARHNLELVRRLQQQQQDQNQDSQGGKGSEQRDESKGDGESSGGEQAQPKGGEQGGGKQDQPAGDDGSQSGQQPENSADKPNQAVGDREQTESDAERAGDAKKPEDSPGQAGQPSQGQEKTGRKEGEDQGESSKTSAAQSGGSGAAQSQGSQPNASDLMPDSGSPAAPNPAETKEGSDRTGQDAGRKDGDKADDRPSAAAGSGLESMSPQAREARQATRAQLERVPDDPGGLLRQRFLLQHLRREGRLP